MEILQPISATSLAASPTHSALVEQLETDAQQVAVVLLELAEELKQIGNGIMSCPNKLECPELGFEELSNIRGFLQAALTKYEHACYLSAHVQDVLKFS